MGLGQTMGPGQAIGLGHGILNLLGSVHWSAAYTGYMFGVLNWESI